MKNEQARVCIFGHYGNRNLGDEAIIQASIAQIRRRLPGAFIAGCSLRPQDTARRHQVEAFGIRYLPGAAGPIRPETAPPAEAMPWNVHAKKIAAGLDPDRPAGPTAPKSLLGKAKALPLVGPVLAFAAGCVHRAGAIRDEIGHLRSVYRYVRQFDLIVFAGSNQFLDNFGGPWGFPYTLFKWAFLAKLTGAKTAFLSIGTNPLKHRSSRWMFHAILKRADYLSYRDESSKRLMEGDGAAFAGEVYPDLAFGLGLPGPEKRPAVPSGAIGINPMPVYDARYWNVSDESQYRSYVGKLARLAIKLMDAGHPVVFFGTMWRDDYVIEDVLAAMPADRILQVGRENLVRRCDEVDDLMGLLAALEIVVATRFHGTLLPLLTATPTFGISYYRKNVDLLRSFGQESFSVELEKCDADEMFGKIRELAGNAGNVRAGIGRVALEKRKRVEEQWDRVVRLVGK